jgi:hypothetical protein
MKLLYPFLSFLCPGLLACWLLSACGGDEVSLSWDNLPNSGVFDTGKVTGTIIGTKIGELSGLAPSHTHPGLYWAHNDKGGASADILYLIDSLGAIYAEIELKGINNRDWEDIAVGPGPEAGVSYVYVGDIGDNDLSAANLFIYRFKEPVGITAGSSLEITQVDPLGVIFANGAHFDFEAMMVDPRSRDILLASKGDVCNVYRLAYPQAVANLMTAELLGEWPIKNVTGGDIAANGNEWLIRTTQQVYYWKRGSSASLYDIVRSLPEKVSILSETNGEAVCFNVWATGFFTCGELPSQLIHFYGKK